MASAHFVENKHLRQLVGSDPRMGQALLLFAERIGERARELAPVDEPFSKSPPHYRDQIEVRLRRTRTGRYVGEVVAQKYTSVWIEFGTGLPGRTPVFAPLRKAVNSLGLRFFSRRGRRARAR